MAYVAITDSRFCGIVESWLQGQQEILVLIRYSHAAGSRDFELFSSFRGFTERMRQLPPLACVTVFRQPQLPLRGVVDDEFIDRCLNSIPAGVEYLVVETIKRPYVTEPWNQWHRHNDGDSREELRTALEDSRGVEVAVGYYPSWLEDNEDVVSAVVPDEHGGTSSGVY